MAQNRTNGGFVSNMYEIILNAYKYFRILLHFGNYTPESNGPIKNTTIVTYPKQSKRKRFELGKA